MCEGDVVRRRLPSWLRVKTGKGREGAETRAVLAACGVHTVCQAARCPNLGECFRAGTATFMILGDVCTRDCRFCAVPCGRPALPDPDEPRRVAEAAARLGLEFVVVTSVTRDDLPDGGAAHFAASIQALRARLPQAGIEVLVPDFLGRRASLETVVAACPTVLNHNIETVRRLSTIVRPQADYERSLTLLATAKELAPQLPVKSGLMVGLGERDEEVYETLVDLRAAGCDIVTVGQYLRPSPHQLPVDRYVNPEGFHLYETWARELGFVHAASGPFVRSSYHAAQAAKEALATFGQAP
ncbi:MAG: lipoyl synthase [Armatimonadetes bacterium]|nr:lipoyl synthase [Armatimonadota bacterium]